MHITSTERKTLRDLAQRVADIAADPVMAVRRAAWVAHNSLRSHYPMMLIFPEGSWQELLPEDRLASTGEQARNIERNLRRRIYTFEHFQDDTVAEREWGVGRHIKSSGWGLESRRVAATAARGAWHFDPVIKVPADLKKLRHPEITVDEKGTAAEVAALQDLFGDILEVKLAGVKHISYHLMNQYTAWRGLEEVMVDMYTEPAMLHAAMAFLEEGHHKVRKQYEALNLLALNNDGTYQNSGGNSYTDELPAPGCDPARVWPCDMWASAEAQEMALVSPEHHETFVMQYEKRLLAPFGLTGYGCCEDLSRKLDRVCTIPHIRRISIAPAADVERSAAALKGGYILSWKPQPAHMVGAFNTGMIREYIRHAVRAAAANGCVLEMILKDTHTCENHPERFDEWTRIAREVIREEAGAPPAAGRPKRKR